MNKVVARFADGRIVKGTTADFVPTRPTCHVHLADAQAGAPPYKIHLHELKALFFVKDFSGDPQHVERAEFDPAQSPAGRRIAVHFKDGEVLLGTTIGYEKHRPGFFLVPADADSNLERCWVAAAATLKIAFPEKAAC